jgi:hypothetical protein
MTYAIATVTKGAGDDAHYQTLAQIKALAEAAGWVTQRYDTGIAERELILFSDGTSGTESIYVGFKCYQSVGADYYNIIAACFTGYVAANAFESQPGYKGSGVPSHNLAVTYFMTASKRRIVGCMKVGSPVYAHFHVGKMLPWMRPGDFPSPLVVAGHFNGREAKRFSDPQWFPYKGIKGSTDSGYNDGNLYLRDQTGTWNKRRVSPFSNAAGASSSSTELAGYYVGATAGSSYRCLVPAGTNYQPQPLVLYDLSFGSFDATSQSYPATGNVFGMLDGVVMNSGFNNTAETVMQTGGSSTVDQTGMTVLQAVDAIRAVGGRAFVMLPDCTRNSWRDFVALEMS